MWVAGTQAFEPSPAAFQEPGLEAEPGLESGTPIWDVGQAAA